MSDDDTGPIPAVGIPEKYQRECTWGDCPIYQCQHCRDNGTFNPKRFNFDHKPEPRMTEHIRSKDRITGPFLSDPEVRKVLEGMGIQLSGDPVNEALQRNRFRKGRGLF